LINTLCLAWDGPYGFEHRAHLPKTRSRKRFGFPWTIDGMADHIAGSEDIGASEIDPMCRFIDGTAFGLPADR
jgi:hypothetical protein